MFHSSWSRNGFSDTSTDSSFNLDKLKGKTLSWLWLAERNRKLVSFPMFTGNMWRWFLSSFRWTRFFRLQNAMGKSWISFWLRSKSFKDDTKAPVHNEGRNSLIRLPCKTSSDNADKFASLLGTALIWLSARFKHDKSLICRMRASIRTSPQLWTANLFSVLGNGFPRG